MFFHGAYDLVDIRALSISHLVCGLLALLSLADTDNGALTVSLTSIAELIAQHSDRARGKLLT